MKLEVTRDIVSDIWPLYRSGEASADSQALVDAFLSEDVPFAATLDKIAKPQEIVSGLRLSPDAERRLLDEARSRARLKLLLVGGSVALAGFIALVALAGVLFVFVRG